MSQLSYWQRQGSEPLFSGIEWNKPERRDQAGRLIIAGGNRQALSAPAESYEITKREGIGQVVIALPDKTKRLVGPTLPDALFLPSTQTGEFSQDGEQQLLERAMHSDCLLLPGDLGRNSQTTILLEQLLKSYLGLMVVTRDTLDLLSFNSELILNRQQTTLVASFAQLQKIFKLTGSTTALKFNMNLAQLVETFHVFSLQYKAAIVTLHQENIIVAVSGNVSTTKVTNEKEEPVNWRLRYASLAACYQTWNSAKPFEALTYSAYRLTSI